MTSHWTAMVSIGIPSLIQVRWTLVQYPSKCCRRCVHRFLTKGIHRGKTSLTAYSCFHSLFFWRFLSLALCPLLWGGDENNWNGDLLRFLSLRLLGTEGTPEAVWDALAKMPHSNPRKKYFGVVIRAWAISQTDFRSGTIFEAFQRVLAFSPSSIYTHTHTHTQRMKIDAWCRANTNQLQWVLGKPKKKTQPTTKKKKKRKRMMKRFRSMMLTIRSPLLLVFFLAANTPMVVALQCVPFSSQSHPLVEVVDGDQACTRASCACLHATHLKCFSPSFRILWAPHSSFHTHTHKTRFPKCVKKTE